MAICFHCRKVLDAGKPGRADACPACGSDVKVCLNCRFHDRSAYNDCREPSAERVIDKERSNFCEYFEHLEGAMSTTAPEDPLKELKRLFRS
ncbi:MAG TPA: hypothetical protein DDW94_08520 [Deltaproteobacteria bacterium]|nr:hypothetical protein [Deltaproteobacteria bacterium]HCY10923.1 hypothetical protein [Deltaproteobacteria bacterium]